MNKTHIISVTGLGVIGLMIAQTFSKYFPVIGYDINSRRINELSHSYDRNQLFSETELRNSKITYTTDVSKISAANFHIVIVPTQVTPSKEPDISIVIAASNSVASQIKKGDIIVYSATVYPGVTEKICIPILEKISHLKAGVDFFVGYSPERVNPADEKHSFHNTDKLIAAQDKKTLEIIKEIYGTAIKAKLIPVENIQVAEASKILENTQRDVNIAFINEAMLILHESGIDAKAVLNAASTKWNFSHYQPVLVGGDCIGPNSYFLLHKAKECNSPARIIEESRNVNDLLGKYIAEKTIKYLIKLKKDVSKAKVAILGFTFKENFSSTKNTHVIDIINTLKSYHIKCLVHDPYAEAEEVKRFFHLELTPWDDIKNIDALILAVPHKEYKSLKTEEIIGILHLPALIIDIKGIFIKDQFQKYAITLWQL